MRDRPHDLGQTTRIVLVTFGTRGVVSAYRRNNDLPYPVLIDEYRDSYRAYGFGRGSVWRVWGWKAARRYVEVLRAGAWRELRRPTDDTLQLGGDVVIAPDGTLAWSFQGEGPDDRPSVDELVAAVEAADG